MDNNRSSDGTSPKSLHKRILLQNIEEHIHFSKSPPDNTTREQEISIRNISGQVQRQLDEKRRKRVLRSKLNPAVPVFGAIMHTPAKSSSTSSPFTPPTATPDTKALGSSAAAGSSTAAGTSSAWRGARNTALHELQRTQALLTHCGFGRSLAVPKSVNEWNEHKQWQIKWEHDKLVNKIQNMDVKPAVVDAWLDAETLAHPANALLAAREKTFAKSHKKIKKPFLGRQWENKGWTAVTGYRSMWTGDYEYGGSTSKGKDMVPLNEQSDEVPWPTETDFRLEGDARIEGGLPRQLPLPRSNRLEPEVGNWLQYEDPAAVNAQWRDWQENGIPRMYRMVPPSVIMHLDSVGENRSVSEAEPIEHFFDEAELARIGEWSELLKHMEL